MKRYPGSGYLFTFVNNFICYSMHLPPLPLPPPPPWAPLLLADKRVRGNLYHHEPNDSKTKYYKKSKIDAFVEWTPVLTELGFWQAVLLAAVAPGHFVQGGRLPPCASHLAGRPKVSARWSSAPLCLSPCWTPQGKCKVVICPPVPLTVLDAPR